jgi:hypothetical protein
MEYKSLNHLLVTPNQSVVKNSLLYSVSVRSEGKSRLRMSTVRALQGTVIDENEAMVE